MRSPTTATPAPTAMNRFRRLWGGGGGAFAGAAAAAWVDGAGAVCVRVLWVAVLMVAGPSLNRRRVVVAAGAGGGLGVGAGAVGGDRLVVVDDIAKVLRSDQVHVAVAVGDVQLADLAVLAVPRVGAGAVLRRALLGVGVVAAAREARRVDEHGLVAVGGGVFGAV